MKKNIAQLFALVVLSHVVHAGPMPPNSILGFGTQKIDEQNVQLVQDAIDNGYRFFDGAQKYRNIELIAPIIKNNKRDTLYVLYKITPPTSLEDVEKIKIDVDKAIQSLGGIDGLMFHSVEDFYDTIETDFAQSVIDYIKELISNGDVAEFGLSNVFRFEEIVDSFKKRGLEVRLIENKFDNNTLHFYPTKNLVTFCKERSIKFIAYGALGGIIGDGPCRAHCEVREPVVHFDEITHPRIIALSKKYAVDPMMLVLAFEAKKYGVHQIPTTTNTKRLKSNFTDFTKAYDALEEHELQALSDEIGLASENEFPLVPSVFRQVFNFRSRLRLIEHLVATKHPLPTAMLEAKALFDAEHEQSILLNKMLYVYEQARKFGKEDELSVLLAKFNELMKVIDKERFKPILSATFDLKMNQAGSTLLQIFLWKLRPNLQQIELLHGKSFTAQDDSNQANGWPQWRKVLVMDVNAKRIFKFDIALPVTAKELREKFMSYGIDVANIHFFGGSFNLEKMDDNLRLASDFSQGYRSNLEYALDLMINWFVVSPESPDVWISILSSYDPFSQQDLYRER